MPTIRIQKTSHKGIPTLPRSKCVSKYYKLRKLMSWREYDPGKERAYQVGQDLLDWATNERAMSFQQFFIWYGISGREYYRLRNKYEIFEVAHDMARMMFGVRREHLALEGKISATIVMKTLHKYHSVWKKIFEEERDLRRELKALKEKSSCPTKIIVVRPEI